jgi:hypothetical protein
VRAAAAALGGSFLIPREGCKIVTIRCSAARGINTVPWKGNKQCQERSSVKCAMILIASAQS